MRDPARIDKVLAAVGHYWRKNPDMRFGQLIDNVAKDPEVFYIEDDDLIWKLVGVYEDWSGDVEATKTLVEYWTGSKLLITQEDRIAAEAEMKKKKSGGQTKNGN